MVERLVPSIPELVAQRVATGSLPGLREDPYRLEIVAQGNAMATARVVGMLVALQDLGALSAVDHMRLVSGSAAMGVTAVVGRAWQGTQSVIEKMSGLQFIDPVGFVLGDPLINVPYLIDGVIGPALEGNWERVLKPDVPFSIYVACVKGQNGEAFLQERTNFQTVPELKMSIADSCGVPIWTSWPRRDRQGIYWGDGAFIDGSILLDTVSPETTHELVLLCDKQNPAEIKPGFIEWLTVKTLQGRGLSAYADKINSLHHKHNETIRRLRQNDGSRMMEVICATDSPMSYLETRRAELWRQGILGYQAALETFSPAYETYGLDIPISPYSIAPNFPVGIDHHGLARI